MSTWSRAVPFLVAHFLGFTPWCRAWLTLSTTPHCIPSSAVAHRRQRSFAAAEAADENFDGGQIINGDVRGSDGNAPDDSRGFYPSLVDALDLVEVMRRVAAHAATKRGQDALMSLVTPDETVPDPYASRASSSRWKRERVAGGGTSSRERRALSVGSTTRMGSRHADDVSSRLESALPPAYRARLPQSRGQAQDEYRRVEQAMHVLQAGQPPTCREEDVGGDNGSSAAQPSQLSYPNLYGHCEAEDGWLGPWSDDIVVESDDDEWLHFRTLDDFDLEHVAHAEQVMTMLRTVHEWAVSDCIQASAPLLSEIGRRIRLEPIQRSLQSIRHAVEIVRVRSVVDPLAQSTYRFQLNATTFPVVGQLREALKKLEQTRSFSKTTEGTVESALESLRQEEFGILRDLVQSVVQARGAVHEGLNAVAELDVLFAKAAFGLATGGRTPLITGDCSIDAKHFVHPLLTQGDAVPIDLRLSRNGTRALAVTGMNGGGKTLALKSFGIAASLTRLGIPIPVEASKVPHNYVPVVTFFEDIVAAIGDRQDVANGESTFTSSLNTYSEIIDMLSARPGRSCLILLDELGSGTDPESGGAIGQAILERLLESDWCRVVVTTHSPRLKALAYDSDEIDCASVLQGWRDSNRSSRLGARRVPTFQLQYGTIGESDAVGAASRTVPPLPLDVIDRASALLLDTNGSETEKSKYVRALSDSLEGQRRRAEESACDAEREASRARQCRITMETMARSYDMQLSRLVNRVEECYQLLRDSSDDPLTIAGETLNELRVIRKQVRSEAELLREQGLKVVPEWYTLTDGESVVVVRDGEWNGMTGRVLLREGGCSTRLAKDEVEVLLSDVAIPPLTTSAAEEMPPSQLILVFKRLDLAIWDYESVWDDAYATDGSATRSQDSKRRLTGLLTTLKTATPTGGKERMATASFKSSRDRKAAKSKKKAKKPTR